MASTLVIQIKSELSQAEMRACIGHLAQGPREVIENVDQFVRSVKSRKNRATLNIATSAAAPVQAAGTATLASVADSNTIVIGGVTLTAKTSPAGSSQFARGVSNTADATALKNCINAHPTLSQVVTATSAAAVVTITANVPGVVGNFIVMSGSGTFTLVQLTGGAGGATEAPTTVAAGL